MPLKVPIRTYRAAIQGQEANARASVALAPPSLPACSIEGQRGHGDEPAKPEDGGQWRAGPGYPGLYRPKAHRQHRAFAAGSATMGSPHESPFCLGLFCLEYGPEKRSKTQASSAPAKSFTAWA